MARSGPGNGPSSHTAGVDPARVGYVATRVGFVVVVLALPLALATFLTILSGAPTVVSGLETALAAATGPLTLGSGVGWLFHVGVLAILCGTWILGLGLVLSGLFD